MQFKALYDAAGDGNLRSLEMIIKRMYKTYAKALRPYQAYLDEIKSDQRDEAAAFDDKSPTKNTMNLPSNLIIR